MDVWGEAREKLSRGMVSREPGCHTFRERAVLRPSASLPAAGRMCLAGRRRGLRNHCAPLSTDCADGCVVRWVQRA